MKYIKSNFNPKGKRAGDCVVRAIGIAERKTWLDVYKSLCKIGEELCDMPNSKPVYEEYLKRQGWIKNKMPRKDDGKRYQLWEFADKHDDKLFIVSMSRHLATVEKSVLLDTWNCGRQSIGNYFTK